MTPTSPDAGRIAAGLTPKARRAILWPWPLHFRWLHHTHLRWFHRNRLIEDHSATEYRLTPLGLAVRAHLKDESQ